MLVIHPALIQCDKVITLSWDISSRGLGRQEDEWRAGITTGPIFRRAWAKFWNVMVSSRHKGLNRLLVSGILRYG